MGFFNKTEEERRQEEDRRMLISLRDEISYNSKLISFNKRFLIDYLNKVIFGTKKNDFFEADFLVRVFDQFTEDEYRNGTDVSDHLSKVLLALSDFFPYGKESSHYNEYKEFFINNVVGVDGLINKGVYDYHIYYIMKDFDSYVRLMNTISRNDKAVDNFYLVKQYINNTGKYAIDEESFVKAVVSTINGLDDTVIDVEQYLKDQLEEDKKRVGVYSISHDDIMTANKSIQRMNAQIEQMDELVNRVNKIGDKVSELTQTANDDINVTKKESLKELNRRKTEIINEILASKSELLAQLKKDLLDEFELSISNLNNREEIIINNLTTRADSIFTETLNKYKKQLTELKKVTTGLSNEVNRSIALIKEESDKSLVLLRDELQSCLERAEEGSLVRDELKNYLDKLDESADVRDRLLQLIDQEKETLGSIKSAGDEDSKIVKGIGRVVVPASPKIELPDSIVIPKNVQIISPYAFKNATQFHKKLKAIEDKKLKNEENGEIYHKKIMEVIECLMVGDWPYMFGPSGAGKGYIIKQIGDLIGQKVIDGGKIGEVHTVLGYIDAQGRFRATPALEACVNGDLIFFDEFDNGNSDTRVALNVMYSNLRDKINDPSSKQYIKFAGEIDVPINPNMRMIAAGNTDGTGSDELFTDRYPTDESIKERYKPIYVDYDNEVEARILQDYQQWYDFFVKFREACNSYASSQNLQTAPGNASTRDASDIFRDVSLNAKTLDQMMSEYFVQIKEEDYRNALAREIAYEYGIYEDQTDEEDYNDTLADATDVDIAKQFVKRCNLGIRG